MCRCLLDTVILVQGCDRVKYLQTFYVQMLMRLITIHLCILHALMMFRKSLRMIKTDRKMSELRKTVFKEYNFNISALVGLLV